jgi:phage FluMu protein Com
METQWRKLEEEIKRQPMPREFAEARAEVRCNDCNARSIVGFHWLGCKCPRCDGFNTVEVRILAEGDAVRDVESFAVARRERREVEQRARAFDLPTRPRHTERSVRVRPYFQEMDERNGVAVIRPRSVDSGFAMPTLPHLPTLPNLNLDEMLARVSRGLTPIRHYFDGEIIDAVPSRFSGRDVLAEAEGSWTDEGDWFVSSDEDDDDEYDSEDYEDEDGSEEESDAEGDAGEEGEDEGGGERLDLNLLGHR